MCSVERREEARFLIIREGAGVVGRWKTTQQRANPVATNMPTGQTVGWCRRHRVKDKKKNGAQTTCLMSVGKFHFDVDALHKSDDKNIHPRTLDIRLFHHHHRETDSIVSRKARKKKKVGRSRRPERHEIPESMKINSSIQRVYISSAIWNQASWTSCALHRCGGISVEALSCACRADTCPSWSTGSLSPHRIGTSILDGSVGSCLPANGGTTRAHGCRLRSARLQTRARQAGRPCKPQVEGKARCSANAKC